MSTTRSISLTSSGSDASEYTWLSETDISDETDTSTDSGTTALPYTILQPNSPSEKAYSHLLRIAASPLARSRISPVIEVAAIQVEVHGIRVWQITLQLTLDGCPLEATGTNVGKKVARELAAIHLRNDLVRVCGHHFITYKSPVMETTLLTPKIEAILQSATAHVERLADLARTATFDDKLLMLDIELWDQTTKNIMLEVGLVVTNARAMWYPDHDDNAEYDHLIIADNMGYWNGQTQHGCPNHKFDYSSEYGVSRLLTQGETTEEIIKIVTDMTQSPGRNYLVGHSIDGDAKWLRDILGVDLSSDFIQIDLAKVYMGLERRHEKRSLSWLCKTYGLEPKDMHNSGNDAALTFRLAKRMVRDAQGRDILV